jgi:4a-hydroxytetrahydrobiopterin dehydratase
MEELAQMACEVCRVGAPTLTEEEIGHFQPQVPEWKVTEVDGEKRLERDFKFRNFAQALAFTNRVGEIAEQQDHHPLICTTWGKVTVSWWTHKIGGLHQNDFVMAAKTDRLLDEGGRE